jgi:hypothetical protein
MTSTQPSNRRRKPVQAAQTAQQPQPVRPRAHPNRPAASATTAAYLALNGSHADGAIEGNEDSEGESPEPVGYSQPRFDASIPVDESDGDEDEDEDEDEEGTSFIYLF